VLSQDEPFKRTVADLLAHVERLEDRTVVRIRETIHLAQFSQMHESLVIGCRGLTEAGIHIPPLDDPAALDAAFARELERFRANTQGSAVADRLYNLPTASTQQTENLLYLIGAMADCATITNLPLLNLLAVVGSNVSLEQGNTQRSPLANTLFGQGMVSHFRAYKEASALATVATRLMDDKFMDLFSYGRATAHQLYFVLHWSRHIELSLPVAEDAFAMTRRAHDPLYGEPGHPLRAHPAGHGRQHWRKNGGASR
jgi:hypothetical protein